MSIRKTHNARVIHTKQTAARIAHVAALAALLFGIIAAGASCSDAQTTRRLVRKGLYNCDERFQTALERMDRRRFNDAVRIFEEIKFQCGGAPLIDSVYFHTGMAHMGLRQHEDARFEFDILLREFPRSHFAEEARFRIAQIRHMRSLPSFRDQSATKEAMSLFNDYLDHHPEGVFADSAKLLYMNSLNRLAQKDFNTARFYRRQRQHEAALIYYRSVLSSFPDSEYAPESAVGMAEMLLALGRVEDAREAVGSINAGGLTGVLRERLDALTGGL